MEFSEVVELNVGGRHMSTLLSTLSKYPDSMLAAMFSGRHHVTKDKDGRFFIDADGDIFSHLLNFLRFETMPPSDKALELTQYAEYFGIYELKMRLNEIALSGKDRFVVKWTSNIPGYSESLSFVKEQLMNCNIEEGYIILYVMLRNIRHGCTVLFQRNCERRYPRNNFLIVELNGMTISNRLQVKVHKDCDMSKHGKTLLTLLSNDLEQCGLCTEATPVQDCCFYGRVLKVMSVVTDKTTNVINSY